MTSPLCVATGGWCRRVFTIDRQLRCTETPRHSVPSYCRFPRLCRLKCVKSSQGLSCQGSHPGCQPDESPGCNGPCRTSRIPQQSRHQRPRREVRQIPSGSPGQPHGGGQVRSSLPRLPLSSVESGDPRPEGRVVMAHPYSIACLGQRFRHRIRHSGYPADHGWKQSRTAPLRGCFRSPVRSESDTRLLRQDQPAPAESGGDRQANAALYRIVVVRLRHDGRTREYMRRRTGEGMSKTEVILLMFSEILSDFPPTPSTLASPFTRTGVAEILNGSQGGMYIRGRKDWLGSASEAI